MDVAVVGSQGPANIHRDLKGCKTRPEVNFQRRHVAHAHAVVLRSVRHIAFDLFK